MIHVNLYLRQPNVDKKTPIFLRIFANGVRSKYPTLITVHPSAWDFAKQRIKPSKKAPNHLELNMYLENILNNSRKAYWDYVNANEGKPLSMNQLKDHLDTLLNRVKKEKMNLIRFIEQMIDHSKNGIRLNPLTGKHISDSTIRTYNTTLAHLKGFQNKTRRRLDFEDVNLEFYNQFSEYLIKEQKLSTNSVGKNIQVFKLIMNEAVELGHTKNTAYKSKRFVVVREESESIYLDKKELKDIENLDLSEQPKLEKTRDLFLIGCYTGLRYSDYSILNPEHIRNGFIQIKQVKTTTPITIPVHDTVKRIIEKYNGNLPKSISNQKTNDHLKDIGKLIPSLEGEIVKSFTKEGVRQQVTYKKWEMISSHTARRSFATNEYLAGTPTLTIMAITGHKTEKAFLRYIKLTSAEHAKLLKAHWEERKAAEMLAVA